MQDPKVTGHFHATLKMLSERHGEDFRFTIIARDTRADGDMDGRVYVVGNDHEPSVVHGVLGQIIAEGLLGDQEDGADE